MCCLSEAYLQYTAAIQLPQLEKDVWTSLSVSRRETTGYTAVASTSSTFRRCKLRAMATSIGDMLDGCFSYSGRRVGTGAHGAGENCGILSVGVQTSVLKYGAVYNSILD